LAQGSIVGPSFQGFPGSPRNICEQCRENLDMWCSTKANSCRQLCRHFAPHIVLTVIASSLAGCGLVNYPRCEDTSIDHGIIRGDWRGLKLKVDCHHGYEYKGGEIECYDYAACSLQAYTTNTCNVSLMLLPLHDPRWERDSSEELVTLMADDLLSAPAAPAVAGLVTVREDQDRRLRGHGGGASLAMAGGDVFGTKLPKWTDDWKKEDLKDWVKRVNCSRKIGTDEKHEKHMEVQAKFDLANPHLPFSAARIFDVQLLALFTTTASAAALVACYVRRRLFTGSLTGAIGPRDAMVVPTD